mgnify:FL=1
MYGNVSTANSKLAADVDASGGLYGAGQFGYSINSTGSTQVATVANATSASVYYDVDVNIANFDTVSVPLAGLSGYDTLGIRAFRIQTGSTDIAVQAQYTKINGSNLEFVVADGLVTNTTEIGVIFHKQPVDNDRGDFEASSTAAVDTSITIPEIDVQLASEAIVAKTRKLKAQWTPEFAQDLNAYHSIDAEAELTSLLSEYISMEIDLEILDMLIQDARTTDHWSAENNKVWSGTNWTTSTSDFYNTQGQWLSLIHI